MKIIGITGGVGAGKTELLSYIQKNYPCRILFADEAAHLLEQPGEACYAKLIDLLGREVCDEQGQIDKKRMAQRIFADETLLESVNTIVHPAVKTYILQQIEQEKVRGEIAFFFIEAALLIEEHYELICDELWYIYADKEVRKSRLKEARAYSDEKIEAIMNSQLSDEEFRRACAVVIDNSGMLEKAYRQIDAALGGIRNGNR